MSSPDGSLFAPSTSPFIRRLPIEIRSEIYKLLLVNPILGTFAAVEHGEGIHQKIKYDLDPEILMTCRQIYQEASDIFYAQTFAARCSTGICSDVITPMNPFLQPWITKSIPGNQQKQADLYETTMRKVRSWNIFVDNVYGNYSNRELRQICQVICDSCPRQVNIVLSKFFLRTDHGTIPFRDSIKPWELMRPLTNLRNVGLLTFGSHLPQASPLAHMSVAEYMGCKRVILAASRVGPASQKMLKKLAGGNSPVERLFQMYQYLAGFALSFEIHVAFKLSMAPGRSESNPSFACRLQGWAQSDCKQNTWKKNCYRFNYGHYHVLYDFLDAKLDKAREYAYEFHSPWFKRYRKRTVQYLSPHFDRLAAASKEVDEYLHTAGHLRQQIETEILLRGRLEDSTETKAVHLVTLIENYASSFERHKLLDSGATFLRYHKYSPHITKMWEREILLDRLASMMESHDYTEFNSVVTEVLAEMNGRLAKIRHAGKHLFDGDGYGDWRCDVEMHFLGDKDEVKV
ncbi:hypothetical protein CJF32_00004472 [Rutstroemia sp. NJR-2017a WRK4]|nr:hypothetical protein CJF32_00004472 [Rutstroemia sp. NJR-2017a WRK4]